MSSSVVYSVGLRTRFRGLTSRSGVLLEGPAGWGEFAPFDDYDEVAAGAWLRAAEEAATASWPAAVRDSIPVNVTVPAVAPVLAAQIVRDSGGCRTAKVKVAERGQLPGEDEERLAAVRNAIGRDGRIRIDVNGGWDVETAIRRIRELDVAAGALEYVEQPCATVEELAEVRRRVDVPIAADESIRRAEDPLRVVRAEAADIAVLKVAPLGGVRACLRLAEQCGIPVVVSSALETSVGLSAGLALAAALPELPYACGLATAQLLERDVVAEPLLPVDGCLPVGRVSPDPSMLAATQASPELAEQWERRLAAVRSAPAGRPYPRG